MRLKANIAGLPSPLQQAEMKSILAGAWPPLKPLPVFKYETADYRATIDFDKRRGEWVCRKTSLPSNKIQELRGGLREITMALPHGETEIFTEGEEQQEHELGKDANRRLQAIREWTENYESGALYFELRDYLSESQRAEIDDSLRLSLTARQLQFNPKNIAYVFDALSTAGGRFATLIEFAKHNKAKRGTAPETQGDKAVPEGEHPTDQGKQSLEVSSREFGNAPNNGFVRDREAAERRNDLDEFPALSIKNVLPEQEKPSLAEWTARHTVSQQSEVETSGFVDADSPLPIEHPYQEGPHSPAFNGFAGQVLTARPSVDAIESSPSRFPGLDISVFQVAVFAALFLSATFAFTVGLTVGRGPLGSRLQVPPKSMCAPDTKSPELPDQADESTSRAPAAPVASLNASGSASRRDDLAFSEEKSKENTRGSELFAKVLSPNSDSSSSTESKPSAKLEVDSAHGGATGLIAPSRAPQRQTPRIGVAPHLPRSSAILVTLPGRGSQPFRVRFPEKAVAATSSFAMSSQLSVLVSPEPGITLAHKPVRLEAGELVSFVWPRYPRPRDEYGLAEIIRVRATIGHAGQVLEVKFLSGSISLLPSTTRAIRQWRYRPTLLDKRPVRAEQDITIEFRPPQYSARVSTRHPSHN